MNMEELGKGFYIFLQTKDIIHELYVKALNKKMFNSYIDFINHVESILAEKGINEDLKIDEQLDIVKNVLNIVENEIEIYDRVLN
jgi:vacuolar-type H+-ATPase subunit B/Vma2